LPKLKFAVCVIAMLYSLLVVQ